MVMPSKTGSVLSPANITLDPAGSYAERYTSQRPTISIASHAALLKSNIVLERLANRLNAGGGNEHLSPGALAAGLRVEGSEQTNVLNLIAADTDPARARDIANAWAVEYAQYSLELIEGEVKGSGNFILEQFEKAETEMEKAEQAVRDFEAGQNLALLDIRLKESQKQLESHYERVCRLEFDLKEKQSLLAQTSRDIAAVTQDGRWIGSYSVSENGIDHFTGPALEEEQKPLREKILSAKAAFEQTLAARDEFINESKINSLRVKLERTRQDLINDKSVLDRLQQLSEATQASLDSKAGSKTIRQLQAPLTENLSDFMVWQILSIAEGYNFLEPQQSSLASKIERQEDRLKSLEKIIFEYEERLRGLETVLQQARSNYDFHLEKFKELEAEKNSLEAETAAMRFELDYSGRLVETLQGDVKNLQTTINDKNEQLAQLKRRLTISKNSYDNLLARIEEARIAKAMELGEVKVVSTAYEPAVPVRPRKKLIVSVGGILGLILGCLIAFSRHSRPDPDAAS